ncbi:MAG: SDR family oxidoreductase [Planctomycetota bacterium]|nr:MAG: SDR family oxidoreductase [Planctomycetota bacterium]
MHPAAKLPPAPAQAKPVLVTGATGYIGGRLVPWLLSLGWRVRVAVRSREKVLARPWANDPRVEVVLVDLADQAAVTAAMRDCGAAYYLVHSMMTAGAAFHDCDRRLAEIFAAAAAQAGLERIIYLGGLGEDGAALSAHLASRRAVEQALASGPVPLTALRAGVILGSGSASFEMVRYLVERLPCMVTPRWVRTECQPIAVRNVLYYLAGCLSTPQSIGATLDLGGPEVLTYQQLMQLMARALGLPPRWIIPVPILSPRLSSWWIHLVTPIDHRLARPLAEGLRNRVVCADDRAVQMIPQRLLGVQEAMELALERMRGDLIETRWSDAGAIPGDPQWAGGTVLSDTRMRLTRASSAAIFAALSRIGGDHGWFATDYLWRLRGFLDRLVGGPGLRRGRRDQRRLSLGDAVDFWRVSSIEANHSLELAAEMRLPGEARLHWRIVDRGERRLLIQQARFRPHGLWGILYWYSVLPLHGLVFPRLLKGIVSTAEGTQKIRRAGTAQPQQAMPQVLGQVANKQTH